MIKIINFIEKLYNLRNPNVIQRGANHKFYFSDVLFPLEISPKTNNSRGWNNWGGGGGGKKLHNFFFGTNLKKK